MWAVHTAWTAIASVALRPGWEIWPGLTNGKMTRIKEKQEQLEAMVAACGDVDAEVRYDPAHGHITIMV